MKLFNIINILYFSALFLSGANAAFAQAPTFVQTSDTLPPPRLIVDVNNDGRDDLVWFSASANSPAALYGQLKMGVSLNQADGTYAPASETLLPLAIEVSKGHWAEKAKLTPGSNNYGIILSGVASTQGVNLNDANLILSTLNTATLQGNGDGTFGAPVITPSFTPFANPNLVGVSSRRDSSFAADLTGAGYHAQLVNFSFNSLLARYSFRVYSLNADGTYTTTPVSQTVVTEIGGAAVFVESVKHLHGNSKDDFILKAILDRTSTPAQYAIFSGGGTIQAPTLTASFTFPSDNNAGSDLIIGDFNGDGFPDFLKSASSLDSRIGPTHTTYTTSLYLNDGIGKPSLTPLTTDTVDCTRPSAADAFVCVESGERSLNFPTFSLLVADFDGDGYDDLITTGDISPLFYKSNGNGTFQSAQAVNAPNDNALILKIMNIGSNGTPSIYSPVRVLDPLTGLFQTTAVRFFQNGLDVSTNSITSLSISPTTPLLGQGISFSVRVTGKRPGGVVNFSEGARSLGSAALINGVATLTLPAGLTSGTHGITASFPGDFNNRASSATSTVTVASAVKVATTTILTTARLVKLGSPAVLSAKVTGNKPTGMVLFVGEENRVIGSASIINGTATLSIVLPNGEYEVKAKYAGDAANLPSKSNEVEFKVRKNH
jgi:uncharacterized protein YjbI with pentapeptide repeats